MRNLGLLVVVLAGLVLPAPPLTAQGGPAVEHVRFAAGRSSASLAGTLTGDETIDYRLAARAGQAMQVKLKATNPSTYFNLLPPGSQDAIFIGSLAGDSFAGRLPKDGEYTVRVYLMRNAARRNEASRYEIDVAVTGP